MRLLNTTTLTLFEFHGSPIPLFAILSHRWEENEIAFQDVQDHTNLTAYGWTKLQKACHFARESGNHFLWIDTCCIDKTSTSKQRSASHTYATSRVVYQGTPESLQSRQAPASPAGWTPQELLAD
jgi:Heterokaryon incompatibility protein (HET)